MRKNPLEPWYGIIRVLLIVLAMTPAIALMTVPIHFEFAEWTMWAFVLGYASIMGIRWSMLLDDDLWRLLELKYNPMAPDLNTLYIFYHCVASFVWMSYMLMSYGFGYEPLHYALWAAAVADIVLLCLVGSVVGWLKRHGVPRTKVQIKTATEGIAAAGQLLFVLLYGFSLVGIIVALRQCGAILFIGALTACLAGLVLYVTFSQKANHIVGRNVGVPAPRYVWIDCFLASEYLQLMRVYDYNPFGIFPAICVFLFPIVVCVLYCISKTLEQMLLDAC